MFRPLLASFLTGALFLTACGGSGDKAADTGKASKASSFNEEVIDIETMADIMTKYGYNDPEEATLPRRSEAPKSSIKSLRLHARTSTKPVPMPSPLAV
jgi:hypothetical protein